MVSTMDEVSLVPLILKPQVYTIILGLTRANVYEEAKGSSSTIGIMLPIFRIIDDKSILRVNGLCTIPFKVIPKSPQYSGSLIQDVWFLCFLGPCCAKGNIKHCAT